MSISPFRSTAAVAAVAVGTLAFVGSPASAQVCYPPTPDCVTTTSSVVTTGPTLTLSATTVARGQTIGASITGFQPGSTGILTIESVEQQIGSFRMPDSGAAATASIRIPTNISLGAHTVFARGTLPNGTAGAASQRVTVVGGNVTDDDDGGGGGTGGTGRLARTGIVVVPTALVGLGLVAGGLVLKRSSRRGKTNNPA